MDLNNLASNIECREEIWFAKNSSLISYPEQGNDLCMQVEDNSYWFKHRNNFIIELVKKYSNEGLFFDIGGGNGFVSLGIDKNTNLEVVLVEPGIKGILNGQKRGLKNLVCSTLDNAGFKQELIPAIGAFDVVEHIEEDDLFLKSMYNFLQYDGLLYLTLPTYNFLWSQDDTLAGHYRRYTLNSIKKKLNTIGFKIEYASYMFSILPLPIFIFRSLPSIFHINSKNKTEINSNKNKKEHTSQFEIINKIWDWEIERVKNKKTIPFGSSCVIVARKL